MTDPLFQVAITGYGKSARNFHLPLLNLHNGYALRSVLLPPSSTTHVEENDVLIVRSLKELLKDDKIDLVIVTSPNRFHFEQAKKAICADKHVVIEKPMAVKAEEAASLIELAASKNKMLTVFHNRRGDSDFLTLKKALNNGLMGDIVEVSSSFNRYRQALRPGHWKESPEPGSGILYDISPHLIDQALLLFGFPDSVIANVKNQREGEADDAFWIKLLYLRKPVLEVTLSAGMLAADPSPRFVARGTKATLVIEGKDAQESALANGQTLTDSALNVLAKKQRATLYDGERGEMKSIDMVPGTYPDFYDNLYYSITKTWDPPVQPETARMGLEIVEAAIRSSKSGRIVEL